MKKERKGGFIEAVVVVTGIDKHVTLSLFVIYLVRSILVHVFPSSE